MTAVTRPNLPQNIIRAAVCGCFEPVVTALKERGVDVLTAAPSPSLPAPVRHHADMLCCHAAGNIVVTADEQLCARLAVYGVKALLTDPPGGEFPLDCSLNCLSIGNYAVGRQASLDRNLLRVLEEDGRELIDVRQGYARCSVAVVDEHSVITADRGIEKAMSSRGFEVLLITPGHIFLEGYDTGFIGGCCGKISADRMLFCGDPMTHPDGERIIRFLSEKGVAAESSGGGLLTDFGGFIPLCE